MFFVVYQSYISLYLSLSFPVQPLSWIGVSGMRTGIRAEELSPSARSSERSVTKSAAQSTTRSTSSEKRNETTHPTESGERWLHAHACFKIESCHMHPGLHILWLILRKLVGFPFFSFFTLHHKTNIKWFWESPACCTSDTCVFMC